jgi:hypothetical protein
MPKYECSVEDEDEEEFFGLHAPTMRWRITADNQMQATKKFEQLLKKGNPEDAERLLIAADVERIDKKKCPRCGRKM